MVDRYFLFVYSHLNQNFAIIIYYGSNRCGKWITSVRIRMLERIIRVQFLLCRCLIHQFNSPTEYGSRLIFIFICVSFIGTKTHNIMQWKLLIN